MTFALLQAINQEIFPIFLWAAILLLFFFIAWKLQLLDIINTQKIADVSFSHLAIAFAIYIAITIFVPSFMASLFNHKNFLQFISLSQLVTSIITIIALFLYGVHLKPSIWQTIWGRYPFLQNLFLGAAYILLAIPVFLFFNLFFDFIVQKIFHIKTLPDQEAILYLKMTLGHPLFFFIALFVIIIYAPIVEELLFRGFLQSWIKKHLGSKLAIILASICFAFFHFSINQGFANISIIGSLFFLSCLIGFLYERQKSLFAPIGLHAVFNTISALHLIFYNG